MARPRALVTLATFLALAGAAAVLIAIGGRGHNPTSPVSEHEAAVPSIARTVAVSTAMPMPSAHARRLSAMLEEGAMPEDPMMAEVVTDSDCTPDAKMISHCRNVMRLADGKEIVLRHPHGMSKVPYLAPGERVRLVPAV